MRCCYSIPAMTKGLYRRLYRRRGSASNRGGTSATVIHCRHCPDASQATPGYKPIECHESSKKLVSARLSPGCSPLRTHLAKRGFAPLGIKISGITLSPWAMPDTVMILEWFRFELYVNGGVPTATVRSHGPCIISNLSTLSNSVCVILYISCHSLSVVSVL